MESKVLYTSYPTTWACSSHISSWHWSSKPLGFYSALEVQLILNDMLKRLTTGNSNNCLLQRIALVQTCVMTGLRIGSLAATNRQDPILQAMQQRDVTFTCLRNRAWTLFLKIKHLKGYNAAKSSMEVQVQMCPLQVLSNILLELTVIYLLLLINQGALQADGPDRPKICSVKALLASESHCFVGVGDHLMFQSLPGKALDTKQACNLLAIHTNTIGLPYALYHRLRKDFAMQMQMLFGSAVARELMHHNVQHDALNCHYTGGIKLFNLVGLQTGKVTQGSLLQASNCKEVVLSSCYNRAFIGDVHDASRVTRQGTTRPGQRVCGAQPGLGQGCPGRKP